MARSDFNVAGMVVLAVMAAFFLFMLGLQVLLRITDLVNWIFKER